MDEHSTKNDHVHLHINVCRNITIMCTQIHVYVYTLKLVHCSLNDMVGLLC